jgi:hypothetical protein
LLKTFQRFLVAAEFQQRVGVPHEDRRIFGPLAIDALRPLRFRVVPAVERGGGLRHFHAAADGRRIVERAHGDAIVAFRIERVLRRASHAARSAPAQQLRHDDGEEIDYRAQWSRDHQNPEPIHFAAGADDVNAAEHRRQIGQDQIDHGASSSSGLRGSAFAAGAKRMTSP